MNVNPINDKLNSCESLRGNSYHLPAPEMNWVASEWGLGRAGTTGAAQKQQLGIRTCASIQFMATVARECLTFCADDQELRHKTVLCK